MEAVVKTIELAGKPLLALGVTIASVIAPDVEVPEYIAFGGMIEMLCNSAIGIIGVFAAYITVRILFINFKDREFNLNKKLSDAKEENLKSHMEALFQKVVEAIKTKN